MFDIKSYHEASTVKEAIELLEQNPEALVINGGTDLLLKLRERKIREADLVSIWAVDELREIGSENDGTVYIGAGATFSDVMENPQIREKIPALAEAAGTVGGPQIRNMGTIGGNLCNGVPSADTAPILLAHNAKLEIAGPGGTREVSLADFYEGPGQVKLEKNEILKSIRIEPQDYKDYGGHYIKYSIRKAMDIATLGTAAVVKVGGDNVIEELRLAFGVAAPTPIRCYEAEKKYRGSKYSEETLHKIANDVLQETRPRSSWRASREYRQQLIREKCIEALREAYLKAGGRV